MTIAGAIAYYVYVKCDNNEGKNLLPGGFSGDSDTVVLVMVWHLIRSNYNYSQPDLAQVPVPRAVSSLLRDIRSNWDISPNSIYGHIRDVPLYMDEALNIVHEHQHPQTCDDQNYLLSFGYNSGFGSEIHVEGYGLAVAMEVGRVYLSAAHVDSRREWQSPTSLCLDYTSAKPVNALGCYYEAWSNCSSHSK